jgi:isochorismate hydrolase
MRKEPYFTSDNIDQKALEILNASKRYSRIRPMRLKKNRMALLILDMQNFFLDEKSHAFIPAATAIIPKIITLKNICIDNGIPVIFTRHSNTDDDAQMMVRWWRDIIRKGNKLSGIYEELNPRNGIIIEKTQYDSFYNTDLEHLLISLEVEQLIVCGVMTNLCCETTVRSAFVRGFEPFFPIDLTAAYNYVFHLSTIINLAFGITSPILSDQIIKAINDCYQ